MKAIIAGAGIGGLTTALMLHARGIDCQLYEAAPTIRELGVGINVLPHAIRELAELGILPTLDRIAIRTSELFYMNRQGQEIWREPRGVEAGYDVPQFSIHRGRLQSMLHDAVLARLGPDAVKAGKRVTGFAQASDGVTLQLEDGGTASGDLLIGADGIHSRIRAQLHPAEPGLRWNGVMMWRGATEWPAFADGRTMIVAGGFVYKLVLYPIAPGSGPGTVLMNWVVCYRAAGDGAQPPAREDWNRRGTLDELMLHVRAFDTDVIDLAALVAATREFFEYPMCDRDPLPFWTQGRVTLLGDAAHPMYPVGSNGASQAILDARALADLLAHGGDVPSILAAYDATRRPATAAVVALNRQGGPEGVIDEVERRAPNGFSDLDAVITPEERHAIVRGYAATAGFSQDQTRLRRGWNLFKKEKQMELMTAGVTTREASVDDVTWHILGQTYVPKHRSDSSMSWHATFPHGTFVPHHIHTTQDEFIYVLTGELELELDGAGSVKAGPGDLVRMPQNVPHGIFNRSGADATCLFWVSPTANLWELFVAIDNVPDPAEVVRLAALHQVDFLPPPAQ